MCRTRFQRLNAGVALVCVTLLTAVLATAQTPTAQMPSAAPTHALAPIERVPVVALPSPDRAALAREDEERDRAGLAPRYAVPYDVDLSVDNAGVTEQLDAHNVVWRLRVLAPGASSLNLGFGQYFMPAGGRLDVHATDLSEAMPAFTEIDNAQHGELWTPIVASDDVMLEVTLPAVQRGQLQLQLVVIGVGYRGFGDLLNGNRAGTCNNDVICPVGDPWRDEIPCVAVISTGGSLFCTGFMVNNTAQDQRPYFMTANHCGVTSGNAASLVAYWNFQSPTCGQQGGGSLSQFQTGAFFRATYATSDFTLVELDSAPNPAWGITFAGWDNTSADASSACGIHHPNCDEKSISFDNGPTTTTSYLGETVPGDGTHVRITQWDDGTTEPGSSGSPLFNQAHRVIGQLHGGYASCTSLTSDWYGRFSRSWTGGGTSSTRLSNWLDPSGSGATVLDTLVPGATGMSVTPSDGLTATGNAGGPFTPASKAYTVQNNGTTAINYSVTVSQAWLSLTNASGSLAGGASVIVTVSFNSQANMLLNGTYTATVTFTNNTDHAGDTTRPVQLGVGVPSPVYTWNMNTNPGWSTEGQWAWGVPTGQGSNAPDPTSGYTGSNVYGYNLNGDYANNIPEYHLTSVAIDCSQLSQVSVKFQRWLGVQRNTRDHAYFRVSNDAATWTTLWENGSTSFTDGAWIAQSYDISAIADGHATVYLRWTMGTTNATTTYCGWNVDDVEIWGVSNVTPGVLSVTPADGLTSSGTTGGPFSPGSKLYTLSNTGGSSLNWTAAKTQGWVTLSVAGGTLTAGGTAPLTVSINANANSLPAGNYGDTITITNTTNGTGNTTRPVALGVTVPFLLADMNCDGVVNAFDIDPFVLALTQPFAYAIQYPDCEILHGDCNSDGLINAFDIDPFVALLTG